MKSRAVLRTFLQQAVRSQVKLQSGSVYLSSRSKPHGFGCSLFPGQDHPVVEWKVGEILMFDCILNHFSA